MIVSFILLLLVAYILYCITSNVLDLRRNLKAAQKSGIYYIVVPVYWLNRFWLITHRLWCKIFAIFPARYTQWVDFVMPESTYDYRHEIFKRIGHDTFLTVAPGGLAIFTCDAAVISQITTRRNDFPKPTAIYRSLDIYGKNVVSTEGHAWRQHRKATSPPFTEKNNKLVWSVSIKHATEMLQSWLGGDQKSAVIDRIMDDTMRLSLYVISGAGFGRTLQWPEATSEVSNNHSDPSKITSDPKDTDAGHAMSWTYALHCLLDTILFQFLLPRWVIEQLPLKAMKKAKFAYEEWGRYMQEAVDKRREEIKSQTEEIEELDILRQLVKSQMEVKGGPSLSNSEILGNMFVLILAGHETAANSIHFAILYLALYPESQRNLQRDLEQIFGGKLPQEWDYERDLPALFGGMAGAVLAEELRLVPPVVNIPKSTIGVSDQVLNMEGRDCTVPAGTYISVCTAAVQRNPTYWPHRDPQLPGGHTAHPVANIDNDLEEFHPERWLSQGERGNIQAKKVGLGDAMSKDGLGLNESPDTSDDMYRPVRGSYIPFSDGARSCLGRRFAQVEVLAVLAVLYQNQSIELSVSKYATDAELEQMTVDQRAEVWQKAAEDARDLLINGMGVIISLQMRKGSVPVRVVPKGQEMYPANVDEIWKRNHPQLCSQAGLPGWRSWDGQPSTCGAHVKL